MRRDSEADGADDREQSDARALAEAHSNALTALSVGLVGEGERTVREATGEWRVLFPGGVVTPDDDRYGDARRVWNGLVPSAPVAVAYPTTAAGVARVVAAARETGLGIATRSGGHSSVGTSTGAGVLVCDVGAMREVTVDPDARTATVEPGVTVGELDAATTEHGLATPQGVAPEVGATGLTLGGGTGYLSRAHGLACDRLSRVDLVTAGGERVTASPDSNPGLFRALCGAGGDFGVAVELEFDLVAVPDRLAFCDVWLPFGDADRAAALLREYRERQRAAPRGTSVSPYVATVPDESGFPDDRAGEPALCVLGAHAGDPDEGERALEPFRRLGDRSGEADGDDGDSDDNEGDRRDGPAEPADPAEPTEPIRDRAERLPYTELQAHLGGGSPAGDRYCWKSVAVEAFTDELAALVAERMVARPGDDDTVVVWPLGGAVADVAPADTAVPERGAETALTFEACWTDPAADEAHLSWARESAARVRAVGEAAGELPNFSGTDRGETAARNVYAGNYGWLRDAKARWDPDGLFSPSGRL